MIKPTISDIVFGIVMILFVLGLSGESIAEAICKVIDKVREKK